MSELVRLKLKKSLNNITLRVWDAFFLENLKLITKSSISKDQFVSYLFARPRKNRGMTPIKSKPNCDLQSLQNGSLSG